MSTTERYVIDFDHHGEELTNHNDDVFKRLMYNEAGCPMGWSEHNGGFWSIWGYDALYDAVQNAELFSSAHSKENPKGAPGALYESPLIPIDIDGDIQQEYRKMVLNWFNPGHAARMKPRIEQICTELIDNFIERGEAELSYELFTALPAIVVLEMMDWDSTNWREWVDWVHGAIHDGALYPERGLAAITSLYGAIGNEIAKRKGKMGTDLFSDMMRYEVRGQTLTDEQLRDFAMLVLFGGMDTTAGVTGNTMLLLDKDHDLRQQLIDEMDFIPKAIEEFLRYAGPGGGLYRRVTADTEFHGFEMKQGEPVLMMFWAANRDPKMFPDPEKIDIHRTNNRHMTFGMGPHRCLGSHHARIMFSTMLREVLTRLPDFKVNRDGVERFHDSGSVYAIRHLPVTFTPGKKSTAS
ncbi:MAG: cytochrome P450 [Acidimicrobiia bacterium]